jgi:hypothetical protein
MRYPQVIALGPDDWVANQLAELANDQRWLIRPARRPAAALELARDPRPTVLIAQADPTADDAGPLGLVADVHRLAPDVPAVVVSDVKLPEADRATWVAAALDLGARAVLFPPLTRPVLEDVVGGLMAAAIRRAAPGDA